MLEQGCWRDMLYIAAKAPLPGVAKTRLGAAIGNERAARLYAAFLHDLAARFAGAALPFDVGWFVAPPSDTLAPILGPQARLLMQGEGDWTERQRALFAGAAERHERRTVLVASDSPQLSVATVTTAFELLEEHDMVLGPTYDGGYYLIAVRGRHDVLGKTAMSTCMVFDQLVARAAQLGLSLGLTEPLWDVDEACDLAQLAALAMERSDLRATVAALHALELLPSSILQAQAVI